MGNNMNREQIDHVLRLFEPGFDDAQLRAGLAGMFSILAAAVTEGAWIDWNDEWGDEAVATERLAARFSAGLRDWCARGATDAWNNRTFEGVASLGALLQLASPHLSQEHLTDRLRMELWIWGPELLTDLARLVSLASARLAVP